MIPPTKAEKREVIKAAKKMGARIYSTTRWYDNGTHSVLEFRALDTKRSLSIDNWSSTYPSEYEAALAFLKRCLIDD
jgi:hypothetical protein